jgi:uncharacterized spore protein YtfJ
MEVKELLRDVAEKIERTANVKAVFGEPIGEGNEMVIPVARVGVRAGGGGGSGDSSTGPGPKGKGNGIGLGMKIDAAPVGYIKRPKMVLFLFQQSTETGRLHLGPVSQ